MKQYLSELLEKMNIGLPAEKACLFEKYYYILTEWNEKINLTAITEMSEVLTKHFCDSLAGNVFIKENASLIDVGTGAGFPAVPLAILRDDIDVLLLDSLAKRIKFLDALICELGLKNVKTVHMRAEEGSRTELRDSFDVAVSRAVASLNVLSEFCLPYVKNGGVFLAYKGLNAEEELSASTSAIKKLNGKADKIYDYNIPDTELEHKIIPIYKIGTTPDTYPRMFSKIQKKPL